ncbi:glycine--tRNA ligase subunit beta [Qipengyuania sp.]|uniref:glycine--tRNA ligase subunit beta n=1 Tax=Qipengyuania sp. TaxID=2004515 RepID=UPI0037359352
MQAGARAELERLFRREMDAAGVSFGEVSVWSTPRRLALVARDLPDATAAVSEEAKGPPEGAPDAAIDGFCRKNGVTREQLELRDVKGRQTWFAVIERPGRRTAEVLAQAIPAIVRDFAWPKSMRWGAASLSTESPRWVRPLSGIVALFGEEVVACRVGGIEAGATTFGHRFHHPGPITIGGAHDYAEKLRACHVVLDHAEREEIIRAGAARLAAEAGLTLVADEGLVIENAGLTEYPVPLLGRFDEAFLDVPPEVIQLTARVNQKYSVCNDAAGKLANAFVCTANIDATDGGAAIVEGNRKVLAARLADARFFWEQDRKTPLAEHAKKLERITFHEKLGTVADKVERVAKLARWLAEEGIVKGADPDLAEQAARLAKADLVSEMVGEFPELQGLMGGYYARAEGLPQEVADAIRDHYKPVGQGDAVPTAPVTVAVSLADKLDTLVGFFAIDEKPTGSKDPFALRRAAISVIRVITENELRVSLGGLLFSLVRDAMHYLILKHRPGLMRKVRDLHPDLSERQCWEIFWSVESNRDDLGEGLHPAEVEFALLFFLAERLKVQQREAGVRHDLIDAVFALGNEDDLVRLLARVKALQAYIDTPEGADLLAAYKRAANILKKEDWQGPEAEIARTGEEDPLALVDDPELAAVVQAKMAQKREGVSYEAEPAEKALMDALEDAEPRARAAVGQEDFAGAMAALAGLREPIDRFFIEVTVNDEDETRRRQRLALLGRFRDAVRQVADFDRIEG